MSRMELYNIVSYDTRGDIRFSHCFGIYGKMHYGYDPDTATRFSLEEAIKRVKRNKYAWEKYGAVDIIPVTMPDSLCVHSVVESLKAM